VSKQQKAIVGIAAAGLFAFILYTTMQQRAQEYEVCVSYKGRSHCAKAAGRTAEEAITTGHQMGCALVTSGRDENMACLATAPASAKRLK